MLRLSLLILLAIIASVSTAETSADRPLIVRAVLDYIESQHLVKPELMTRGLDKKLAKRTFWRSKSGGEFLLETDYDSMIKVAKTYNKSGEKFPDKPRIDIKIFDIDQRTASVKLTADDWIDYMHLYKNDADEWKIINVLWQYHDLTKHASKK